MHSAIDPMAAIVVSLPAWCAIVAARPLPWPECRGASCRCVRGAAGEVPYDST
jgi:hypothetical protein